MQTEALEAYVGISKRLHDVSVEFVTATAKAILYTDGATEVWVPKSQIGDDGMVQVEERKDGTFTLTAPEWWLKERGLI